MKTTGGKLTYVPGMIMHMWHGHSEDRQYVGRSKCLVDYAFDPQSDICEDENGMWKWNSEKPLLHEKVAEYFTSRKEDINYPVHPTRYSEKYPIILDPDGGIDCLRETLVKLCGLTRTDFCVHIACHDWQQSAKISPLIKNNRWPFQIKMKSSYQVSLRDIPRRIQTIRGLGRESNAVRCLFVDKNTNIKSNFIDLITKHGKKLVVDQNNKILMIDRVFANHVDLNGPDCKYGMGEERVFNLVKAQGINYGVVDLR